MLTTLVTGGAGYIGSHFLREWGCDRGAVIVFDNLNMGHREAVPDWATFVQGDLRSPHDLEALFKNHDIDQVVHFAALAEVGQSVAEPLLYYRNNVLGGINLLAECQKHNVKRFVFSSTAATYGIPTQMPITEETPQQPVNPYGHSKLMFESILRDTAKNFGMHVGILRYFNVAGADDSGEIGENHEPETHLLPNILKSLLQDAAVFTIFGDDYPTRDGTCVRDYVHVSDLVQAHVMVLDYLQDHELALFNLGSSEGYTVKEFVQAVERVTGKTVNVEHGPRRLGDPPTLIADSSKIKTKLAWQVQRNLDTMIETAWDWHCRQPQGYSSSSTGD